MTDQTKTWWDKGEKALEPKRSFRWEIEYTKQDGTSGKKVLIPSHYITSVKMPSFSFQKEEVDQIGAKKIIINPHPTFTPVEVTFIDDEQNSIYEWIYWYFYNTGIKLDGTNITPSYGYYNYAGNYNFSRATNFFGSFKIYTLGTQLKETTTTTTVAETTSTPPGGGSSIKRVAPGQVIYANAGRPQTVTTTISQTTSNKYRIDEIELVKPFITDFKQSDLNYNEGGFISYTIQITYASYKYTSYNQQSGGFNSKLGLNFGSYSPPQRRGAGAPQSSGEPVLNNTDS